MRALLRKLVTFVLIGFAYAAFLSQSSSAFYDYCAPAACCNHDAGGDDHGTGNGGDSPDCACHWVAADQPLECILAPCLRTVVIVGYFEETLGELREAIRAIDHPPQLS